MVRNSLILAIETSNPAPPGAGSPGPGEFGAVAVCRAGTSGVEALGVEALNPGDGRDDDLTGAIDRLGRRLGVRPVDLRRIAVSIGPGGFTSVRIAVATAKAISAATGAGVVGVPSADGVLRRIDRDARERGEAVICLAWKRSDVWRTVYRSAGPGATARTEGLVRLDQLMSGVDAGSVLALDARLEERLRSQGWLPGGVEIVRPRFDPIAIAEAALPLPDIDPLALAPLYPREPEAVTKWRELGRGR